MKSFEGRIRDTRKSLSRESETTEANAALGRMKWKRNRTKAEEYLNSEHLYRLRIGAQFTEQTSVMTGWEAKLLNSELERAFIRELDAKKSVRLSRWCVETSKVAAL